MLIRVLGEEGPLLERYIARGELLYIDTDAEPASRRVLTMVMGDAMNMEEG